MAFTSFFVRRLGIRPMSLDDLAITMGKLGEGEWELQLDDGTSIDVTLGSR